MTTLDYLRTCGVFKFRNIKIYLREYNYPTPPPGSKPTPGNLISVSRTQFMTNLFLEQKISNLPRNRSLGIESRVKVGSKILYLPIMDFSISKSKDAIKKIKSMLNNIIVPRFGGGVIVETDKSYHFIGKKLLTKEKLQKFIYWNLIASTLCDTQYIGYWLLKGAACLRISPRPGLALPKVVSVIQ